MDKVMTANGRIVSNLSIDDPEFDQKLIHGIKESGIVVIKNVMTSQECDLLTERTLTYFEQVSDFKKNDLKTWKDSLLPPQLRPGMFHEIVCNIPSVNDIRFNPQIIKIFRIYYSYFKNMEYRDQDLVVSNDGINIRPGTIGPYAPFDPLIDWAHLDQNEDPLNIYKCIQGQMVLSNTSAGFRASPGSHLLFKEFLEQPSNIRTLKNFLKFHNTQYPTMKEQVEAINGSWQIKIPASKGDFIIWTSSTIHSATLQEKIERPLRDDPWYGWRHVVYVCYRPRDEFYDEQLKIKYQSFLENRVTNHWSTMVFPKNKYNPKNNIYCDKVTQFIKFPESVYQLRGMMIDLSHDQKIMMGMSPNDQ